MQVNESKTYTREEYLELEESEQRRYDFFNGEIIETEMGASEYHQMICSNLIIYLGASLRETSCRVLPTGMRIQTGNGLETYPDVLVVSGESEYSEPRKNTGRDTLTNPTVLFEVLSKSTRDYDRGDKFMAYRTIQSLTDFFAIEQGRAFVEHYSKIKTGEWRLREYQEMGETIALASLGIELALAEIYRGVKF